MLMEGLGTTSPLNDYAYNGKELNEDFGLNLSDYGARWYDAALGRLLAVDPIAEGRLEWTVYNYTRNNPINLIDPDGTLDTLPDGRYIWEMTSIEEELFYGKPGESESDTYMRMLNLKEAGLPEEISLTWSERFYILGHLFGLCLPSSKIVSASAAVDAFSVTENSVIKSAKAILESKAFKSGIESMKKGINSEATINGVKVLFQSDGPFSGFTLFG